MQHHPLVRGGRKEDDDFAGDERRRWGGRAGQSAITATGGGEVYMDELPDNLEIRLSLIGLRDEHRLVHRLGELPARETLVKTVWWLCVVWARGGGDLRFCVTS